MLEETLKKNRERDMRMKMTSAGPHRDDLCFYGKRDRYPEIWFTGTAENSGPVFETFRNLSGKRKNQRYADTSSG